MLAEHFLDVDIGNDGLILLQGSDVDLIRSRWRVDRSQLLIGDQVDGVTDGRIVCDAALKFGTYRAAENFAEQIDGGTGDVDVRGWQIFAGYFRDHRHDCGIRAADADEPADGGPHLRVAHLACRQKADPRKRTPDRNNPPE